MPARPSADEAPRATALAAFKLARRRFIFGERIEMTALARDLDVSRVTLNRWVGSRDMLLGEVLWSLGGPALDRARAETDGTGAQAMADTLRAFLEDVLAERFMHEFLAREPEIALRILTTNRSTFQSRFVTHVRGLLNDLMAGRELPLAPDDTAYLVVRIAESFFYVDIIAGGRPDPAKAAQAVAALLR